MMVHERAPTQTFYMRGNEGLDQKIKKIVNFRGGIWKTFRKIHFRGGF